jgi:hypothetical protein
VKSCRIRKSLEDKKMQKIRYNFLFIVGLMMAFSLATAATTAYSQKRPKNTGILSVKTSPQSYEVLVDGQVIGMSGVGSPAEFYLTPGFHRVEVLGPNGQNFSKEMEIRRDTRNCICLRVNEIVEKRACPYNIMVDGPDRVQEGDLVTFSSRNLVTEGTIPVNYRWSVSGGTITSGLGTSSITVDTRGMGGQTIRAFLDVTDDVYGSTCFQKNEVTTVIDRTPEPPKPFQCDIFESRAFDDDKARFDNCVIQLQNSPDSQIYIILYQGTDRRSLRADALSKRTLDYLVRTRGVDPRRIVITKWGNRPRTTYEIWIVPPGAQPPVPQ